MMGSEPAFAVYKCPACEVVLITDRSMVSLMQHSAAHGSNIMFTSVVR